MSIEFQCVLDSESEKLELVFEFLKNLKSEYPNFYEWYYGKVYDGLKSKTRSILLAYNVDDQKIAGVSILKDFEEKKICTFRVASEFQHRGIGTELMKKSIEILDTTSPLITVPEEHVAEFDKLLKKFDFKEFHRYLDYYRKEKYEISYNGYLDKRCLFSIKPEFAFKILSGEKIFEYRKTQTQKSISCMVIYAGYPIRKVIGEAEVVNVICGSPEEVWQLTNTFSGIEYSLYSKYFEGRKIAYAYQLSHPHFYNPYKELSDFKMSVPPQSYRYL